MDRWKSRGGKRQRRDRKKREDQRRERVRRKKMHVSERATELRNTVFFQWFVAPEGRKVGLLKRRVRSHLAGWEMKNCTCLWCEAHCEVQMLRRPQRLSKSNVESTPVSEHFWKLRCWKSARCCGAKHISKSNVLKTAGLGPRLDVQMSLRVACARDSAPCQMWAKREGFVAVSKALAGGGTFEEDLQGCISRGRRSTRDMFIRDVRRSGRRFPERGCILECQIFDQVC